MILGISYFLFSFFFLLLTLLIINFLKSKNLIFSLLYLMLIFLVTASFFIFLGLEFFGYMLIIVYVGAITMLFLFVLMLFDIPLITDQIETRKSFFYLHCLIIIIFSFMIYLNKRYLILSFSEIQTLSYFNLIDFGLFIYDPLNVSYLLLVGLALFLIILGICTLFSVEVSFF
jgi:NADH:ubiquinone oxidoreductase subunit 6 (subunit J)